MTEQGRGGRFGRGPKGAWRRFIDGLEEHRQVLHAYCSRLTGDVWDAEDLVQEALVRVFSNLARSDVTIRNPRAYLIRAATHAWVDQARRSARLDGALREQEVEMSVAPEPAPAAATDDGRAAGLLFQVLHPQERAAVVMKDLLDMSHKDIAEVLGTSVGAVKAAVHRGRGRLGGERPPAGFEPPPRAIVEGFTRALSARDVDAIRALCSANVEGELVGGADMPTFKQLRKVFDYAHFVMPRLGFGTAPTWRVEDYHGEPVVLGFRTLDGVTGLNEVHRLEVEDDRITRVRIYCFCPETLAAVAAELGCAALPRPHRNPGLADLLKALLGVRPAWRRR
ncbi:MAG: RNA polymerase sigma factor [Planctomycetota bacterium]